MRKSAAMATNLPTDPTVQDLIVLAQQALRVVSDLQRSNVPVSATTYHALLNEAAIAIEAVRSTLGPMESHEDVFARLAPWAPRMATPIATAPAADAAAAPKRTRRTKAEMEADAAAAEAAKKLPLLALKEDRTPAELAADGDGPPIAVTNPMPVEAATFVTSDPTTGAPITLSEPTQPGFDRDKAEAALKKTGDEFRASEEKRREREAAEATARAVAAQVVPATAAAAPSSDWKAKLHIAPLPEDAMLPWKNGEFAGKKLSEVSIKNLEVILANYVKGFESETDPEKRSQRALWLERGAAWHRYRFDLLLLAAGDVDMADLWAEYKAKAEAPGPSPAMQMHRKLWFERIEEIDRVRKENEA
jgi:hypothetical protein